jgi:hypothetical protein
LRGQAKDGLLADLKGNSTTAGDDPHNAGEQEPLARGAQRDDMLEQLLDHCSAGFILVAAV